jgi:hypothetical protein
MGWLGHNNLPSDDSIGLEQSSSHQNMDECRIDGHVHFDWLPTVFEFEEDLGFLWGCARPEAEAIMLSLAKQGHHIAFSSAGLHRFLDLTPYEACELHDKLEVFGYEVSAAVRRQLDEVGGLETLVLYEQLCSLAEIAAPKSSVEKQNRNLLLMLLAASYFEWLYYQADFFEHPKFQELTYLLVAIRSFGALFPIGRNLPCAFPLEEINLLFPAKADSVDDYGEDDSEEGDESMSIGSPPILENTRIYLLPSGEPLRADSDRADWLEVRRNCVGATDARKLVKLNGEISTQRDKLIDEKIHDVTHYFDSFERGIEREPVIASWVRQAFFEEEFEPNSHLYIGENERHVATPDMVGTFSLCEIKVSTKSLKTCKTTYRDQLQWQMHVTGAPHVLLVVENRDSEEIETEWISRDELRIQVLVEAADSFLRDLDERKGKNSNLGFLDEAEEYYKDDLGLEETESSPGVRDLPVFELLSWDETQSALKMYCQGRDVFAIAENLARNSNDVVATLGVHMFGLEGALVDASAENWGKGWDSESKTTMTTLVRAGKSIDEICESLGRDRLGVLYRIFSGLNPVVPSRVMKAFKVDL